MKLVTYEDPGAFLDRAQPWLEEQEAANSLMLGVGLRVKEDRFAYGLRLFMCIVHDEDRPALLALMTPPFPLQLHATRGPSDKAIEAVARLLLEEDWPVPGVMAIENLGAAFASRWAGLSGQTPRLGMRSRVHELRQVKHPDYSPGEFRPAREDESELMAAWHLRFQEDAHVPTRTNEFGARKRVDEAIKATRLYVWDHDGPVSTALRTRPTPHGECVGGVYTPPEHRARGYATSCVARLSQRILDSGKSFSCLFTDVANPTSNKIYRRIGYEPVCDFVHLSFDKSGEKHNAPRGA